MKQIRHYFDYKSPYAYLAQADTLALQQRFEVELRLIPYTLDIPAYLGSAEVNDRKEVVASNRNAHQWRRVKYSYMDCRREANRRGIVLKGTRKIFDSSLAHIAFLFADSHARQLDFHASVYEKFWRRELDIESMEAMCNELEAATIDAEGFARFAQSAGRDRLAALREEAESMGVFGVPSYVVDGELFWGYERLERVVELLG